VELKEGVMTALCILLALGFLALLFSRIHFHFSFNLTISRSKTTPRYGAMPVGGKQRRGNLGGGSLPAVRSISDPGVTKTLEAAKAVAEGEVCSALVNLGCDKQKARELAKQAMQNGKDFDSRIRWAIQRAA
jgi:hypothetical protein